MGFFSDREARRLQESRRIADQMLRTTDNVRHLATAAQHSPDNWGPIAENPHTPHQVLTYLEGKGADDPELVRKVRAHPNYRPR